MRETKVQHCIVVYSDYKPEEYHRLEEVSLSPEILELAQALKEDTVIVLGGDGSMLEAIASYYPRYTRFTGINFGNKGFLLHSQKVLQQKEFSFTEHNYPLLACKIGQDHFFAFNEFDIKAGEGKMLDISIRTGEDHFLDVIGDGLLISSPAGSSGYSSSLGAPVLGHDMNSYIITPKAPWKPKGLHPIILSHKQNLTLSTQGRENITEIYSDGRSVGKYSGHIVADISVHTDKIQLYIEKDSLVSWNNRVLEEQGFQSQDSL